MVMLWSLSTVQCVENRVRLKRKGGERRGEEGGYIQAETQPTSIQMRSMSVMMHRIIIHYVEAH